MPAVVPVLGRTVSIDYRPAPVEEPLPSVCSPRILSFGTPGSRVFAQTYAPSYYPTPEPPPPPPGPTGAAILARPGIAIAPYSGAVLIAYPTS